MRRGYDRVEGSIGRSYDEMKGMIMSVSRDFQMLGKIATGKKVKKLDRLSIAEIVDMDVVGINLSCYLLPLVQTGNHSLLTHPHRMTGHFN